MVEVNSKSGFVYTIVIFLLGIALISLMTLSVEHKQNLSKTSFYQTDEQLLAYHLEEVTQATKNAIGLDINYSRNSTNSRLNISDAGFPFSNFTLYGYCRIDPLENYLISTWEDYSNSQIIYNYSNLNNSGWLLGTNTSINYYHDNSDSDSDEAILQIPNTTSIYSLNITLNCLSPINTSYREFDDWASSGSGSYARIYYSDDYSTSHTNSIPFDFSDNRTFSVYYTDNDDTGNWTQTIYVDYIRQDPINQIKIWADTNTSYSPAQYKQNVSCDFSIYLDVNQTSSEALRVFIPVNTTLSYNEASYTERYLSLIRD
jgi:hypothetical protein